MRRSRIRAVLPSITMAGAYGLRGRGDASQKAAPKVFAREDADGVRKKRDSQMMTGGADGDGEGSEEEEEEEQEDRAR